MAHYERGVYEPSDDVRVFDGSEDEEDVEGSRLPLLIVLALLVLAMFAGVVWLAYTQGVARGRSETPVLTAAAGPARVAPPNPGGDDRALSGLQDLRAARAAGRRHRQHAAAARRRAAQRPRPLAAGAKPAADRQPPRRLPSPARRAAPSRRRCRTSRRPRQSRLAALIQQANSAPVAQVAASLRRRCQTAASVAGRPGYGRAAPLAPARGDPGAAPTPPLRRRACGSKAHGLGRLCPADRRLQEPGRGRCRLEGLQGQACRACCRRYSDDVQQADLGDKGTWYRLRIAGFPTRTSPRPCATG